MATKIQIICTKPGMRRRGVEHPLNATYDPDKWTAEDLDAFRADPAFIVQEIDDAAVVTKGDEFEKAVTAKVEERMKVITGQLQGSYQKAVDDAVAERTKLLSDQVAKLNAELEGVKAAKSKPAKA